MAPTARTFHLLVAKNWKILRLAGEKATQYVQNRLPTSVRANVAELEPIYIRNTTRQPLHPAAFLKQTKRYYSANSTFTSAVRRFTSSSAHGARAVKHDRSSFPKSRVSGIINQSTGRAPFASTLRPNVTGGTLGRTAGGYGLGGRVGGVRYFSHTPAAPAHVIQNVNQAIRAFAIGGKTAQYDGVNPKTGEARYRAVTVLQNEAVKNLTSLPKATPGSYIDFTVNPTITALTPFSAVAGFQALQAKSDNLNTEGLLDILSVDFSRSLKELAVILNDLKRLSALGDLPITYQHSCLRIHFPGCDADSLERLAEELGLQRGVIRQDDDFDQYNGTEIALLFPYAPSRSPSECSFFDKSVTHRKINSNTLWWDNTSAIPLSPLLSNLATPDFSTLSDSGMEMDAFEDETNPWLSSPSGYESLHSSELDESGCRHAKPASNEPLEYQGIEGIYRFISEIDAARA